MRASLPQPCDRVVDPVYPNDRRIFNDLFGLVEVGYQKRIEPELRRLANPLLPALYRPYFAGEPNLTEYQTFIR